MKNQINSFTERSFSGNGTQGRVYPSRLYRGYAMMVAYKHGKMFFQRLYKFTDSKGIAKKILQLTN